MARFDVNGKVVQGMDLLRRRHRLSRFDVWPFAIIYALWLVLVVPRLDFSDAFLVLVRLAASHILVLLFIAWSVDFKAFVQFTKVKEIHSASACFLCGAMVLGRILVYCCGKWAKIPGTELLPGNIGEDKSIPAVSPSI